MEQRELAQKIEALLFANGDPLSYKTIMEICEVGKRDIEAGVQELETALIGRGLMLIKTDTTLALSTSQSASDVVERLRREELEKPLGKAGLETIAIILYRGPITKVEIDYIRGVDSGSILRNLMIRGLVERSTKDDVRGYIYASTIDALRYLGLSSVKDLPEYRDIRDSIESKIIYPTGDLP